LPSGAVLPRHLHEPSEFYLRPKLTTRGRDSAPNQWQTGVTMANRFNYRCPICGSQDHIEICAFASVRLTSYGTEGDVSNLGPDDWSSENAAGYDACGYDGTVENFEPPASEVVVSFKRPEKIDPEA
jgi:hypothetical protein